MHRLSSLSPAGLADGLALKEWRYARLEGASTSPLVFVRFAPGLTAIWVPHAPFAGWGFGLDRRGHASSTANASDGKSAATSGSFRVTRGRGVATGLLAGHAGYVAGDRLRVRALEQPGRHAALAGAALLDGVQHALAVEA